MRAAYVAALMVLFAVAATVEHATSQHVAARPHGRLLLAQNVTQPQAPSSTPQAPADKPRTKNNSSDAKQPADGTTQPPAAPSTTPWLGAPPQFQRTWPPTALPQADDNDDLLLMQAPRKPAKVHRA